MSKVIDKTDLLRASQVPVALIQDLVARRHGLQRSELLAHRRDPATCQARHIAAWMAKRLTTLTYPVIGGLFSRDHTTIMSSFDWVEARRSDPAFVEELEELTTAAIAMSHSGSVPMPKDLNPLASARRVALGGARQAMGLSTLEILSVCLRLVDVEELAAGTAALLANLDKLEHAEDGEERLALIQSSKALMPTIASALEALGYNEEPTTDGK